MELVDDGQPAGQRPKSAEAAAIVRCFPDELEADLARVYGVELVNWFRHVGGRKPLPGTRRLTSRRLLVLAEQLPDTSRYKTVQRDPDIGGDWPVWLYLLAAVVNESRLSRVDQARFHGSNLKYTPIESPAQAADKRDELLLSRAAHDHLVAKMSAPKPFANQRVRRPIESETDMQRKLREAEQARKRGAPVG